MWQSERRVAADAGESFADCFVVVYPVQAGDFQLAILRQQAQQGLPARFSVALVAKLVQGFQSVAHGHRAANQILFQTVVGKAQQVVLAGEMLQTLLEVDLHGFGAAGAGQPEAGKFAD
jgi:hypothetical protein